MAEYWRLFIAIALAEETRGRVRAAQEAARGAGLAARWVEPQAAHLTLKFLGDTDRALVAPLCATLQRAVARHASFTLHAGGLGAFPNPRRPRVLWLGLDGDLGPLLALQRAIDVSLLPLGIPAETRPFRPHLTLGRVRAGTTVPPANALVAAQISLGTATTPVPVSTIQLIRSELGQGGPRYTTLCSAALTAAR